MAVKELKPEEFGSEEAQAIFESISQATGKPYDLGHFVSTWRSWMEIGLARAWEAPGCVLGALFTRDLFSNQLRAQCVFWFSDFGRAENGDVFKAFERAAREAGCVDIQSAAYSTLDHDRRTVAYLRHGFTKTETVFTKVL